MTVAARRTGQSCSVPFLSETEQYKKKSVQIFSVQIVLFGGHVAHRRPSSTVEDGQVAA
jgi:hypothetical protein